MTSMDRALMKAIEHVEEKVDSGTSSGSHTHVITDITNLQSKLDTMESKITAISQSGGTSSGSSGTSVIAHTHTIDNIINLRTELDSLKEVPYHSHEIGNIVNLTTKLENFDYRIKAIESESASAAYPTGSIYFTTNTDILTPRDEMANTLWVKVKSPLTNYSAWQRVENKYEMGRLIEEYFKMFYPVGSIKTVFGSDNVTNYTTLLQTTNNFASLTQPASVSWSSTGVGVQNDKLCMGLFSDRSNETTSGMLTDASVYSTSRAVDLLSLYFPVGAIIFFKDTESRQKYWRYIADNYNGVDYDGSTIDIQQKTVYSGTNVLNAYVCMIRNS